MRWLLLPWTAIHLAFIRWAISSLMSHLDAIEREIAKGNFVGPRHRKECLHQLESDLIREQLILKRLPWSS
jgi:hypothetical protein